VLIAVLAVIAFVLMTWFQIRQVRRVKRDRREGLAPIEGLFLDAVITQDSIGYPTISGTYAGDRAKVELLVDTMTMRQLPRLWVIATVLRPLPVRQPVDMVLRPLSTDIASPGTGFTVEHPIPSEWPAHLRISTPELGPLPPLRDIRHVRTLLEDPKTKSLLVAPGGVRIVYELARGDVGPYRVLRRPRFRVDLEPELMRWLLDSAIEVAQGLERTQAKVGAAS
jgi:hypothetical protein